MLPESAASWRQPLVDLARLLFFEGTGNILVEQTHKTLWCCILHLIERDVKRRGERAHGDFSDEGLQRTR